MLLHTFRIHVFHYLLFWLDMREIEVGLSDCRWRSSSVSSSSLRLCMVIMSFPRGV